MKAKQGALALFLMLALTVFVPRANATVEIQFSDGVHTLDILDQGANDSCADVNKLCYIGTLGSGPGTIWDLTVTTGSSKDKAAPFLLDLHGAAQRNAGANSTLTVLLSDNNFTPGVNGLNVGVGGTLSNGGTFTVQGFYSATNTKFDTSNQIGSTLTFTKPDSIPGFGFNGTTSGAVVGADPYALTLRTTLNFGRNAGNITYNAEIDPVPEPASVALLGGILLVTVGAIRRKLHRG